MNVRSPLEALDVERHLSDPTLKQRYVTTMFDLVAPSYDRFTRWFSYGMDRGWKREMVARAAAAVPAGGTVVDLACGTGDVTRALSDALTGKNVRVVGLDPSARMLDLAAHRRGASGAGYLRGDMMTLPVPSGSVDLVTAAYAFRNVPDHRVALQEAARTLKPDGVLVTLDFYQPPAVWWHRVFLMYLSLAGGLYGWLWHRDPEAYAYISRSITLFVTSSTFETHLVQAGFVVEEVRRKLGGGICLHVARRKR